MKYTVITRVADPATGGNLALEIPYVQVEQGNAENGWIGRFEFLRDPNIINFRGPVFRLGEVLVLDNNDRDQFGRKPSKWDVDVEHFNLAQTAFERAREVIEEADARYMMEAGDGTSSD